MTGGISANQPLNGYNNSGLRPPFATAAALPAVPLNSEPLGAKSLSDSEIKKDRHFKFVANPPPIKPHSFYNELKLDKDNFMEYLTTTQKVSPELKNSKKRKAFSNIVKIAITAGLAIVAFKKRAWLKNFCVNAYNKVRNLIKK